MRTLNNHNPAYEGSLCVLVKCPAHLVPIILVSRVTSGEYTIINTCRRASHIQSIPFP